MRNALVYTEEMKLFIRKPNGLEYEFDNVDKPELGFDYDVIVYDDIEMKVVKWDDSLGNFDNQIRVELENSEKDSIEEYIEHSEPPMGVTLNTQFCQKMSEEVSQALKDCTQSYGFDDLNEVLFAGREGSNHPHRSNARRVMEFGDACYNVGDQIQDTLIATREDQLEEFGHYQASLPKFDFGVDHPR